MSKFKFYHQLKAEEKELLETLSALQLLIKRYETENNEVVQLPPNVIVEEPKPKLEPKTEAYDSNMSIAKKLMYVLKTLNNATSREVAEKAYELDKSRTQEQWIDDARFYLSKFFNEGKVTAVIGNHSQRGKVYSLPSGN